ncbi:predicted protein [Nematostella vectensis]|uniref:Uncharacterized protein n=1 Tax=Nematostella vectensis TaxID=45351 RepID=A7RGM6_NEMVE|nr:predicted protein [Nematostella vectensis]|eukprot:XP_001641506.1 predicted protein [Nematostella vectensis]
MPETSGKPTAFSWKSTSPPCRVVLLICKAAGIYQDNFATRDPSKLSTHELQPSVTNNSTFVLSLELQPGIYHFLFEIYIDENNTEGHLSSSTMYDKTWLASGREVNYVEVNCSSWALHRKTNQRISPDTEEKPDQGTGDTVALVDDEETPCLCHCVVL